MANTTTVSKRMDLMLLTKSYLPIKESYFQKSPEGYTIIFCEVQVPIVAYKVF